MVEQKPALSSNQINSLRYLAKTGPCWRMVPRNGDPELEGFIREGLVVWNPDAGYSISRLGRQAIPGEPMPCPHCGGTGKTPPSL
jgi:hypothetical protein